MRAWAVVGLTACGVLLAFAGASLLPRTPAVEAAVPPAVWHLEDRELGDGGGHLKEGEPWLGHVQVGKLYVHEMVATLTWQSDQASAPDRFTLELAPPSPLPAYEQVQGDGGTLVQRYTVFDASPAGPSSLGRGTWVVRAYNEPPTGDTVGDTLHGLQDHGADYHIHVQASVWVPG